MDSKASSKESSISDKLVEYINSSRLKFSWFIGNLVVVLSFFGFILTYRSNGILNLILYKLLFLGSISTFIIVLYQSQVIFDDKKSILLKIKILLKDDNFLYLYNAIIWLIFPKISISILPYFGFSLIHVLTTLGFEIFPKLGIFKNLIPKIQTFIKKNQEISKKISNFELILLIYLIFRAVLFKNWSWLNLILYSIFIKIKSENSLLTRQILKNWEVRIDGLVSSPNVPPTIKQYWGTLKNGIKKIDKFSITEKEDKKE